jgi:hypothetical protein
MLAIPGIALNVPLATPAQHSSLLAEAQHLHEALPGLLNLLLCGGRARRLQQLLTRYGRLRLRLSQLYLRMGRGGGGGGRCVWVWGRWVGGAVKEGLAELGGR